MGNIPEVLVFACRHFFFFGEREKERLLKAVVASVEHAQTCTLSSHFDDVTLYCEMYATFNCVQHPSRAPFARIQLQRKGWSELDGVLRLRTTVLLKFSRNGILLRIQFEDE